MYTLTFHPFIELSSPNNIKILIVMSGNLSLISDVLSYVKHVHLNILTALGM